MILTKSITKYIPKIPKESKSTSYGYNIYNEEEKWRYANEIMENKKERTIENNNVDQSQSIEEYDGFIKNFDKFTSTTLKGTTEKISGVLSRRIFVSPEPEIEILLQNAWGTPRKRTLKFKNIKNGNLMQPVKVFSMPLSIRNTCAYDTTLEIISSPTVIFQHLSKL